MIQSQTPGFLASPPSGKGQGVLVLHAWWGLNDTIKDFCTRLSGEGFTTFAPDLYHGKLATTIPEAEALRDALDWESVHSRDQHRSGVPAGAQRGAGEKHGCDRVFAGGVLCPESFHHRSRAY